MMSLFYRFQKNLTSKNTAKHIEIDHTFVKKNIFNIYRSILKCEYCSDKFYNEKVYLQCIDCQINVHKKCSKIVAKNCKKASNFSSTDDCMDTTEYDENSPHEDDQAIDNSVKKMSFEDMVDNNQDYSDQIVSTENEQPSSDCNTDKRYRYRKTNKNRQSQQIILQRISQRVKKTNGFFWSGHMFYYTNLKTEVINILID